jgi:acyl carrier protein
VFETLKEILVNKLKVSPIEITMDATKDDVELDSLAVVELAIILDKDLGIKISDDELAAAETIGDIVQLMQERSAAAA